MMKTETMTPNTVYTKMGDRIVASEIRNSNDKGYSEITKSAMAYNAFFLASLPEEDRKQKLAILEAFNTSTSKD